MKCPYCNIIAKWYAGENYHKCLSCGALWDMTGHIITRGKTMTEKSITQLKRELKAAQEALAERDTKAGRIEDVRLYKPLTKSHWSLLRDQGFKTGSTVYAPNTAAADEDWCINCSPDVFKGHAAGIGDADYFETGGFASLYARSASGNIINIICFSDYMLFEAWHKTTKAMQVLRHHFFADYDYSGGERPPQQTQELAAIFEKKWCRVRLFQALRDIFWPVQALSADMTFEEARKAHKCKRCGRRAEFFSSWPEKQKYLDTTICERCREEGVKPALRSTNF